MGRNSPAAQDQREVVADGSAVGHDDVRGGRRIAVTVVPIPARIIARGGRGSARGVDVDEREHEVGSGGHVADHVVEGGGAGRGSGNFRGGCRHRDRRDGEPDKVAGSLRGSGQRDRPGDRRARGPVATGAVGRLRALAARGERGAREQHAARAPPCCSVHGREGTTNGGDRGNPCIMAVMTRIIVVLALVLCSAGRALGADAVPAPPPPPTMPSPTVTVDPTNAPPVASTPAATPATTSTPLPSPADLALKRVLRSSCRDGLDEVRRAAVSDPNAAWAATVTRPCDSIIQEKTQKRSATGGNEGRGRLVLWSSLYGIWLGIATDILFEVDGNPAVIVAPLVGLGAGLGLSLAATSNTQLSVGEAWTIITGLHYCSMNGALWGGCLDFSDKGVVGTAVATSVAATSIGVLVATEKSPSAGDIELVRSGLLWGTVGGALATFAIAPHVSDNGAFKAIALSMDAGFLVGVG